MAAPGTVGTPRGRSAAYPWTLLLLSSAVYFFLANDADNDLWGHVLFGRHILAQGHAPYTDPYAFTTTAARWVDHEWLAQAVMAAVFDNCGNPGLLLLKFLAGAATFGLVIRDVRRNTRAPWQWGGIGLLGAAVLARGFACRPQVVTYLLTAVLLCGLRRTRGQPSPWLWGLPPLFALWANLHGGFVLGLGIVGLASAAATWHRRPEARRLWAAFGLSLIATAINPYGPGLLVYITEELRMPHPITEWQAPVLGAAEHGAFFALLGLFLATLPFQRRQQRFDWEVVLALGVAIMALQHQRHTPLLAICAAAPLATQIRRGSAWMRRRFAALSPGAARVVDGAVVALALGQLSLTAARAGRDGLNIVFDPSDYPVLAVAAMRDAGIRANLAVPLEWGEYVLYFLEPHVKVSLDGRFATLFPQAVIADNFDFFAGAGNWQRLLDAYPTDAALVPAGSACPIATLPGWQRVWKDPTASLYMRAAGATTLPSPTPPTPTGVFP